MPARLCGAALVLALFAFACGAPDEPSDATPGATGATTVSVVLEGTESAPNEEFSVAVDPASAPAGTVTFEVDVKTGVHVFSVYRTDLPADQLPTPNGYSVDVTDERIEVVATDAPSRRDRSVDLQLEPGAYVLVCNLADHYTRGMYAGFEVV